MKKSGQPETAMSEKSQGEIVGKNVIFFREKMSELPFVRSGKGLEGI